MCSFAHAIGCWTAVTWIEVISIVGTLPRGVELTRVKLSLTVSTISSKSYNVRSKFCEVWSIDYKREVIVDDAWDQDALESDHRCTLIDK
jgi:hypothetical protein